MEPRKLMDLRGFFFGGLVERSPTPFRRQRGGFPVLSVFGAGAPSPPLPFLDAVIGTVGVRRDNARGSPFRSQGRSWPNDLSARPALRDSYEKY